MGQVHSVLPVPTVITVFELVPDIGEPHMLKSLFVGTIPYSIAPELALISAVFHSQRDSDENHQIVKHVQYSNQPPGVLLIIQSKIDPSNQHAYLCESADGLTVVSMSNQARPRLLPPLDGHEMIDDQNILDWSRLPPAESLSKCLNMFMQNRNDVEVYICTKCQYRIATTLFTSCGHLCACAECARSMHTCELYGCLKEIYQRMLLPVFLRTGQLFSA